MSLLNNVVPSLYVFGAFSIVYFIDIAYGLYINTNLKGEKFEWKRFLVTISEIILMGISVVGVVFGINLLTFGISQFTIEQEWANSMLLAVQEWGGIIGFAALWITGFMERVKGIWQKNKNKADIKTIKYNEAINESQSEFIKRPITETEKITDNYEI